MMFVFNDEIIDMAINNIGGYIVSVVSAQTGKPLEEVSEAFFLSETYELLSEKETGYYWDSLGELIEKFTAELNIR
jgi:hypothetical protein